MRQPAGQAGGVRARRPGRRRRRALAPLLRPAQVPHRASSTSAAAGAARRTRASWTTPPGTSSPTWSDLRKHLGIERWLVFGGSWGSTLALAYAQAHPARVTELVLRGIFMLRNWEIDWFYQHGASAIFPDRWEDYVARDPEARARRPGRRVLPAAHQPQPRDAAAAPRKAWSVWEGCDELPAVDEANVESWSADDFAIAVARIECHYFVNKGFFEREDQLLRGVSRIRHIPAVIVQGRYDVVCPMRSAWDLHKRLARGGPPHRPGRGAFGARARQRARAGVGHRSLRALRRAARQSASSRRTTRSPRSLRHRVAQHLPPRDPSRAAGLLEAEVARQLERLRRHHFLARAVDRIPDHVEDLVLLRRVARGDRQHAPAGPVLRDAHDGVGVRRGGRERGPERAIDCFSATANGVSSSDVAR